MAPLQTWTDERIAELTRLWADGHSAADIAEQLGCSRNAVLGARHRYRLPERVDQPNRPRAPDRRNRRSPLPRRREVPPLPPARINQVTIEQLERWHCRYIPGNPPPYLYCGRHAVGGTSYCAEHARLCFHGRRGGG